MGYCRDCRWWLLRGTWGTCRMTRSERDGTLREEAALSKANATPFGGIDSTGAILMTAPDFGCVQFQAKTALASSVMSGTGVANG